MNFDQCLLNFILNFKSNEKWDLLSTIHVITDLQTLNTL